MPWIFNYSHLSAPSTAQLLGNAPLCMLPATLESYRVVFQSHSRKWGGAVASLEKKRKATVYGSAILVYPFELDLFQKEFSKFEQVTVKVSLTTGDIVKATTFLLAGEALQEGEPSKEYAKAMTKHLRFFWDSGEGQKLKLEDFLWAPKPKEVTAEVAAPEEGKPKRKLKEEEPEAEVPKKRGRPKGSKNKKKVSKEG